jgi:hypothetical protein
MQEETLGLRVSSDEGQGPLRISARQRTRRDERDLGNSAYLLTPTMYTLIRLFLETLNFRNVLVCQKFGVRSQPVRSDIMTSKY